MKILNLYAGLGGNRKLWGDEHEVTAVEYDVNIWKVYKKLYPNDKVILGDAHKYLLEHYKEFDLIWSSPPCQSHTKMIRGGRNRKPRFPDLTLYEEIIFLKHNFNGLWIVENVDPYYEPLIPGKKIGRHLVWSNFNIDDFEHKNIPNFIKECNTKGAEKLKKWLGINYEGNIYYCGNHDPAQVLRNCVHPEIGLHILNCSQK